MPQERTEDPPQRANAPDVQRLVDRTLAAYAGRHKQWGDAARQDAVESVRRMGRWHLVRTGCRVPLYDLYFLSLRRAGDQLARGFINEAALPVADALARSPAQLMLAGKGCIAPFDLPRESVDLVVKQGLFEADLAFAMRFEQEVIERLEWLYAAQLRRHLAETITRITDAWAALG